VGVGLLIDFSKNLVKERLMEKYRFISNLLDQGVEQKRRGNYKGAKKLYYQAIQLDPHRKMAFYSLAKVCYLTGEQKEAIFNYICAAHLLFHEPPEIFYNSIDLHNIVTPMLDRLPLKYREYPNILKKITPLVLDINTISHLAHVLIDFDDNISKSPDLLSYIAYYRSSLSGKGGKVDKDIEWKFYQPFGLEFLLDFIDWSEISSYEVLDIYSELNGKNASFYFPRHDSINSNEALADKYYSQGLLYKTHDRLDEAIQEFQKALQYNSDHAHAHYSLGLVYFQHNKLDKATKHAKQALALGLYDASELLDEIEESRNLNLAKAGTLDKVAIAELASPSSIKKTKHEDNGKSKKLDKLTQLLNQETDEDDSPVRKPNVKQVKKWWQFWK